MSKRLFFLPAALLIATACGDSADTPRTDEATTTDQLATEMPRNPHVMGIDLGLASDEEGRIIGGAGQSFPEADTLHVSIRTQYIDQGTTLSLVLSQGDRTIGTTTATVGANGESGDARALAIFPQVATLGAGSYRVEALMDEVSQGIREFTIGAQ